VNRKCAGLYYQVVNMADALIPSKDPALTQRRTAMNQWLSAATAIARRSSDAEAIQVAMFLRTHAVLGVPMPGYRAAPVRSSRVRLLDDALLIVPIVAVDSWLLPIGDDRQRYGQAYRTDELYAEFIPSRQMMHLSGEWRLSDLYKGLTLLHEGLHAYDRLVRRRRMPKPFWRRERNARLLEYRVLRRIGGRRLTSHLDELLPRVRAEYARQQSAFRFELPPRSSVDDAALAASLGAPMSFIDRDARAAAVQLCAVVHFFERQFTQDWRSRFDAYVRQNYLVRPSADSDSDRLRSRLTG
jgi:hypothetical protein